MQAEPLANASNIKHTALRCAVTRRWCMAALMQPQQKVIVTVDRVRSPQTKAAETAVFTSIRSCVHTAACPIMHKPAQHTFMYHLGFWGGLLRHAAAHHWIGLGWHRSSKGGGGQDIGRSLGVAIVWLGHEHSGMAICVAGDVLEVLGLCGDCFLQAGGC